MIHRPGVNIVPIHDKAPKIHDTAIGYKIILNPLNETGVRLRMFVCTVRFFKLFGFMVYIVMSLGRAIDTICPVEACVKPLW